MQSAVACSAHDAQCPRGESEKDKGGIEVEEGAGWRAEMTYFGIEPYPRVSFHL